MCLPAGANVCTAGRPAAGGESAVKLGRRCGARPRRASRRLLDRYCVTCHNERLKTADLSLDQIDVANPGAEAEVWEKVVRKLHTGVMPPPNMPQPSEADRRAMLTWLETSLDAASAAKPNPGRTETLRRLNRTEYQNAIRDLLALDIDAASLLPADESGHGFDNVTVGDLSPTLLDRYISAAQKISRLAVGSTQSSLQSDIIRAAGRSHAGRSAARAADRHARRRVDVLYVRPGRRVRHPDLARARSGGSRQRVARGRVRTSCWCCSTGSRSQTFTIQKPANGDDTLLDKDLKARVTVTAGPHELGVTFVKDGSSLIETPRQPTESRFNDRRHPRTAPAIDQISVTGPYAPKGAGDTPSRRRLFVCRPAGQDKAQEEKCAGDDSLDADAARLSPADRQSGR